MRLVRPIVNESYVVEFLQHPRATALIPTLFIYFQSRTELSITAGRHPTVEMSLPQNNSSFIPHSLHLSHPHSYLHLITAPNASGKSTTLRLTAIITILAQVGSFVPADHAEIGIVDRIFTRIGARDEVDRGRSTFMIEMDEAAEILRRATRRSLVCIHYRHSCQYYMG